MAWSNADNWAYSRWVWNIARNSRITEPTGTELAAVKTFLKLFWSPATDTGTRTWLKYKFYRLAVASSDDYEGDIDSQPTAVLVEMLAVVGRDLKKNPLTAAEKIYCDTFITATGDRRYGTADYFGGVSGSLLS